MQWLNQVVNEAIDRQPTGEILVSSGASPSGIYHFGHLREVITCDAIVLALRKLGREARHIHVVDNLDGFRKVPVNLPENYSQYLGMPLCDVPVPDGSARSYADYCLDPFVESMHKLGIEFDLVYQNEKYRVGFYVPAIERSLQRVDAAKTALETVSGRQLDDNWTPIQIMENGRLKNRKYLGLDTDAKTVSYEDSDGNQQTAKYDKGEVKLDWRLDWPGRWWLMNIAVEPFGRDHATKGGSFDTGCEIAKNVYDTKAPIPVPYDFVNRTGDTKKMSASKGTGVNARDITDVLPSEVIRYFMLRYSPSKRLFFDETETLIKLVDDYSELLSKQGQDDRDEELLYLCNRGVNERTISSVPFSHLVATYQASLGNVDETLKAIGRTEYVESTKNEADIIRREIEFVSRWLKTWAPEDVKFSLLDKVNPADFSDIELSYLRALGDEIKSAPLDADGQWFHSHIYAYKDTTGLSPKELFSTIYKALIGKTSGPRVGWFLSILPRDWLVERLAMQDSSLNA
ncbi:MAG: lysine--tRNA ligase [Candidatus Saccharibacteria bacterium]